MLYGFAESLICASNGGGGACGGKAVRLSVRVYANSNDESEEGKQSGKCNCKKRPTDEAATEEMSGETEVQSRYASNDPARRCPG